MALIGFSTFNNYNYTKLALKSIEKYTDLTKHKLVVVDNRSTDGTVENIIKDFPWIHKFITLDYDCISRTWNVILDEAIKENSDFLIAPNDIVVSPNWLDYLEEDLYKAPENVICISPYMPVDFQYDSVVNQDFADRYLNDFRESLNQSKTTEELENILDVIYDGDYEKFCLDFSERNKNEAPFDCSLTHIMYYKKDLFTKYGFRHDERYCPLFGGHEYDTNIQLNNLGLFRISSSRSYVHHWISITHKGFESQKQKTIYENSIKVLQKWEWIPGATTFLEGPRPSNIPNWRTPYHKFKLREKELTLEEGKKVPGIKYMNYEGLHPGRDYFDQIQIGSIVKDDKKSFSVYQNANGYMELEPYFHRMFETVGINKTNFIKNKWHIDYYFRKEEEDYYGPGHMNFLLER